MPTDFAVGTTNAKRGVMKKADEKRLLQAWLKPDNKRRILSHAVRYARAFPATPEDLVQMTWVILSQAAFFAPNANVVWLAQDAMQNLSANRKRTQDYKRMRFFSHKLDDRIPNYDIDWDDYFADIDQTANEDMEKGTFPNPEQALLAKERVLTSQKFIAELKKLLTPIELGIVTEGEDENYDTTELQQKLKCSRNEIYEARRTMKEKAVKLRARWEAGGRELTALPKQTKKEET
jgi:hypothetical protein